MEKDLVQLKGKNVHRTRITSDLDKVAVISKNTTL
jgi:hypothetical protein